MSHVYQFFQFFGCTITTKMIKQSVITSHHFSRLTCTFIKQFSMSVESNPELLSLVLLYFNMLKELRHGWRILISPFAIRLNLLHPRPSLFLFGLLSPLWCFSTVVNYYFEAFFNLKVILHFKFLLVHFLDWMNSHKRTPTEKIHVEVTTNGYHITLHTSESLMGELTFFITSYCCY